MSHKISLEEAVELTTNYRNHKEEILRLEYRDKNILPISEAFDKAEFLEMLNEPECVRFRAYFGMDANMDVRLIFVGVNDKDENILPVDGKVDAILLEQGQRCPPLCPTRNPLDPK